MNNQNRLGAITWSAWVGIGLLTLLGMGLLISFWTKVPSQPNVDEGCAAVEAFLTLVREGKPGEAWDHSTAEFKSIAGRESFVRLAQKSPILKEPLNFNSVQHVSVQDHPRSEFLYYSRKSGGNVRVLIGYEQGEWKVDRLTL